MLPLTIALGFWSSECADGEKDEGDDEEEEELELAVEVYCERKLAPAGPGVAAGPGSPPGSIDP